MNIKAVGLRVPKLLCGPNQTHLSVLSRQAVREPPSIQGWREVDRTPQLSHKVSFYSLYEYELLNLKDLIFVKLGA